MVGVTQDLPAPVKGTQNRKGVNLPCVTPEADSGPVAGTVMGLGVAVYRADCGHDLNTVHSVKLAGARAGHC